MIASPTSGIYGHKVWVMCSMNVLSNEEMKGVTVTCDMKIRHEKERKESENDSFAYFRNIRSQSVGHVFYECTQQ